MTRTICFLTCFLNSTAWHTDGCFQNTGLTEPILAVIELHSILGLIKIFHEIYSDLVPGFKKNIPTLPSIRAQ